MRFRIRKELGGWESTCRLLVIGSVRQRCVQPFFGNDPPASSELLQSSATVDPLSTALRALTPGTGRSEIDPASVLFLKWHFRYH